MKGVDIIHVAPSDLGQSMGNAPQDEVRKLMDEVVLKVRACGKWAGVGGNSPGDESRVSDLINLGANFVTISAQSLMLNAAKDFRQLVKASIRTTD